MVVKTATKKKFMDKGFSEVMAHYLADNISWSVWEDFGTQKTLRRNDSGFEILFKSKLGQASKKMHLMTKESKHLINVALFNDDVIGVAYNMINSLPVLSADAKFPTLSTSQGVLNWVSLEGETYQKKNKMEYTQALSIFNLSQYSKYLETREKRGDTSGHRRRYENWLKRNERYRPDNQPLNPYKPSKPYDYRKTPMQTRNQYEWTPRNPKFDFTNPQFQKEYENYRKMYQDSLTK